jgi:hypothetical protein
VFASGYPGWEKTSQESFFGLLEIKLSREIVGMLLETSTESIKKTSFGRGIFEIWELNPEKILLHLFFFFPYLLRRGILKKHQLLSSGSLTCDAKFNVKIDRSVERFSIVSTSDSVTISHGISSSGLFGSLA